MSLLELLVEFGRTGRIGPLHCGMRLTEAEDLLGAGIPGGDTYYWGDLELTVAARRVSGMSITGPGLPSIILPGDRPAGPPVLLDDLTLALNAAGARHELQPIKSAQERALRIDPGGVGAHFAATADGRFCLRAMYKRADVVVGQTYRVHLPNRSDAARFLTDPSLLGWVLGEAEDFELTVASTDAHLHGEPAVIGIRFTESTQFTTPLPPDAAARLGLPSDIDYVVRGAIIDATSGRVVHLPTEETLTIPTAWLRPLP